MSPEPHARRVLVIDERVELRRTIAERLAASGLIVYDVGSPLGATSLASRLQIDVLVLGARLSSSTGRRVAQLVRNSPRLKQLKVVLLVAELPKRLELSHDYNDVDSVIEESTLEQALLPTVLRLVGRRPSGTSARPVLLVDADAQRRGRLRQSLQALGHAVHECPRGTTALARALETKPRTIVVALDLVDLAATDLVELLRANPTAGASRILLLGDGGLGDMEEARARCGANGVLHADSGKAELEDRLRSDSQTV